MTDRKHYIAICLAAKHDSNGNPQRAWVRIDLNGDIVEVQDEGYRGYPWRGKALTVQGPRFEVTVQEYRDIMARQEWFNAQPVE